MGRTVGCVLNLEGKLEFSSYLTLVLVSHWIGDVRLGSICTNSFHAYCYECWAMGHILTRARAEPNRAEFGLRAPTTRRHECSSIQGALEPETFFDFSILIFI